jgi:hypothetical protein
MLPLLSIYSVDGLTFTGNRLERTKAYPATGSGEWKMFDITDSDNVKVEEPSTIAASQPAATSSN